MKSRGRQVKDIVGQKFNKLLVLEYVGIQNHRAIWKCKCDCGTIKNFTGQDLRNKNPTTIYEWRKYPHRIPKDLDIIFP